MRWRPSPKPKQKFGTLTIDCFAVAVVFVVYLLVLTVANAEGSWHPLLHALANTATLVLIAAIARATLRNFVFGRPLQWQVTAHAALAVLFAFLWYWLLMVALGLLHGRSLTHFEVRDFFPGRALAWQLMQGFSFYGLAAGLSYLQTMPPPFALENAPTRARALLFMKLGEEIHPIDVAQIISIAAADDYSEVTTARGKHLVRMSLSDFENALDRERFARIHRSRIVNLERIVKAEPAGDGRLLLHMEGGDFITTSRAGARVLRERVI